MNKIVPGCEYYISSIKAVKLSKNDKKTGKKNWTTEYTEVTAVSEIKFNIPFGQQLWAVIGIDGKYDNVWESQLIAKTI